MVNSVTFHFSFALQCLGEGELSAAEGGAVGGLVHDSHAEVVAKRAFQLYLIDQIRCEGGGEAGNSNSISRNLLRT